MGGVVSSGKRDPGPVCGPQPGKEGCLPGCTCQGILLPLKQESRDENPGRIQLVPFLQASPIHANWICLQGLPDIFLYRLLADCSLNDEVAGGGFGSRGISGWVLGIGGWGRELDLRVDRISEKDEI